MFGYMFVKGFFMIGVCNGLVIIGFGLVLRGVIEVIIFIRGVFLAFVGLYWKVGCLFCFNILVFG